MQQKYFLEITTCQLEKIKWTSQYSQLSYRKEGIHMVRRAIANGLILPMKIPPTSILHREFLTTLLSGSSSNREAIKGCIL